MIFLDLETTGFDPKTDKIIEFAAVRTDAFFKEHATLEFLVNPQKEIPEIVQQVTKISQSDVENEKAFAERIEEVKAFLGEDIIVGHNIGFDISFLQEHGIALKNPFLDTCDLATILLPAQKSYALEVLSDELNIEHKYKHRALGDVLACIDLMKILEARYQTLPTAFWNQIDALQTKATSSILSFLLEEKQRKNIAYSGDFMETKTEESFEKEEIVSNTKTLFSSLEEAKNTLGSVLLHKGIVVVPKDFISFFTGVANAADAELFFPASKYLDEAKLKVFLTKENFSESETLIFLKILRNQTQQKPLTEDDLNIHWGDFPIWRDFLCKKEFLERVLPENRGILMSYETFFELSNQLKTREIFFFEPREDVLDKASTETVYEQSFLESQTNKDFANAMADLFEEIRNWAGEENEELPYYGKQKLITIEDFYSESFVYLQKKYFSIQTQFQVQNTFFESFFTKTLGIAKQVNMNGKGKLSFVQTQESYFHYFEKLSSFSCGGFSLSSLSFPFLMGNIFEEKLILEKKESKKRPIVFPSAQFPGPKNSNYTQAIKDELEDIFQNHSGRILVVCGSKSQTEELFLHFAVNHALSGARYFVASGLSGGKHKILHYAKKEEGTVVFVQADNVEAFSMENIPFDAMIITKLPFDAPTPLAMFRQNIFKNGFNEYVIPKSSLKIERMIRLIPTHSLYFLDASIQNNWAFPLKALLQSYAE